MRFKEESVEEKIDQIKRKQEEMSTHKHFPADPVKQAVDKFPLLPEFLKVRGLVKQHLDSFNYFVKTDIKKIVRANDRIVSSVDPSIYLRFKDVRIGEPSITEDGVSEKLNPHTCRLSDMTYAAPILVNIEYITGSHAQKTRVEKNDVVIGRMPIMLRSCCCVLYRKDEAELARLGECPLDPGGYFVIKGTEKPLLHLFYSEPGNGLWKRKADAAFFHCKTIKSLLEETLVAIPDSVLDAPVSNAPSGREDLFANLNDLLPPPYETREQEQEP